MTEMVTNVSRRGFLKNGVNLGAVVLGAYVTPLLTPAQSFAAGTAAASATGSFAPNVYLSIDSDGSVKIVVHRSEMGQGIRTSLPMIVADELEADWQRITIEQAEGDARYGSQNTDGSRSVRRFYQPLRTAGASARYMLEQAAANRWKVSRSQCRAIKHQVVHQPSGKKLDFGELVEAAAQLTVPSADQLNYKTPKEFRYIGQSLPIVDMQPILTGKAQYGIDTHLPGMKFASIERPPVLYGTAKTYNKKAALAVPGVKQVIVLPTLAPPVHFKALGGVAVIARNTWAAQQGRQKLDVQWEDGVNAVFDSDIHRREMLASARKPGRVVRSEGDINTAFKQAGKVIEAEYHVPMLTHVAMEPPSAVADVKGGRCEVWACVQAPQATRKAVAEALGLSEAQVKVNVTLLGGGFGRKSKPDFAVEAALLSKQVGAPIKVTWTREDDIRHSYYHAVSNQYLKGALDAKGAAMAWLHRTVFPSISTTFNAQAKYGSDGEMRLGFSDNPFAIPNMQLENGHAPAHVRIGWLRSVCNIYHAFAIGSFADELARAAGRDPADYLAQLIGSPRKIDLAAKGVKYDNYGDPIDMYPIDTGRLLNVLNIVKGQANWGRKLPRGRGLGIAVHRSFLSYVATVVEVAVSKTGALSVRKIWMAVDCGTVVNPDRVRAQMEGASVFGLSLALHGEITARKGRIEQSNFHDYPVARIGEVPDTEVHIVSSNEPPAGVGEPGTPPLAPALCNAIFAATGKRIRQLPVAQQLAAG